nr:hypothetical protein [Paenibacillus xylanexedens]
MSLVRSGSGERMYASERDASIEMRGQHIVSVRSSTSSGSRRS